MRPLARAPWLLALVLLARVAGAEEAQSPWRSQEILDRRLGEACDAVEKACGAKFEKRPGVRISEPADVTDEIRRDLEPALSAMGQADRLEFLVDLMSKALAAKYDDGLHVIHVIPDNVARLAKETREPLGSEAALRAILAHEATHALDFPRFEWGKLRASLGNADELEAFGAVSEGHAQLIAEEVCAAQGLSEAFAAFTRSISAIPQLDDPIQRNLAEVLSARMSFGYVVGHAFLRAVRDAKGREGVEAVLRTPPKSRRVIENPRLWISPEAAGAAIDLEAAVAGFAPLFEGPTWAVETDAILRSVLATQVKVLPKEQYEPLLAAYEAGAAVVASNPETGARTTGVVLEFRTDADATAFVGAERAIADARKLPPTIQIVESVASEGAGEGSKRPGYVLRKKLKVGPEEIVVEGQVVAVGRYLIELNVVGKTLPDRKSQDAGVEAVAAVLEGKAPTPARLARRVPEFDPGSFPGTEDRPRILVKIVGPDGEPVPVATVTVHGAFEDRPGGKQSLSTQATGGRISMPVLAGKPTLDVTNARAANGTPLDYGPARGVSIDPAAKEMTVELKVGLTIEGIVVDPDGQPVAGASVALARETHGPPPTIKVRSGPDGAFRLVGLGPEPIRIEALATGRLAGSAPVSVKGGDAGVRVALREGRTTDITVVDPAGKPLAGARVRVVRVTKEGKTTHYGTAAEGESNATGRVALAPLALEDTYRLEVSPPRDSGLTRQEVELWRVESRSVTLTAGFTIRGVVRDESGAPVGGAMVDVGHHRIPSDPDGRFESPGHPRETVWLSASATRGGKHLQAQAKATPDQPEVELVLKDAPPTRAMRPPSSGKVSRVLVKGVKVPQGDTIELEIPEDGSSVVSRRVEVWPESETTAAARSRSVGQEGMTVFPELDPGAAWVVWIGPTSTSDEMTALMRGVRFGDDPVEVTVQKGETIRGTLVVPAGSNARNHEVAALHEMGMVVPGRVLAGDTYEIRGLPKGTRWTVRAKARGADKWLYGSVAADAGAEVEVRLAPK